MNLMCGMYINDSDQCPNKNDRFIFIKEFDHIGMFCGRCFPSYFDAMEKYFIRGDVKEIGFEEYLMVSVMNL